MALPRTADPMFAMLRASQMVRDGSWIRGAPSRIFAEFLAALEADGWELVPKATPHVDPPDVDASGGPFGV